MCDLRRDWSQGHLFSFLFIFEYLFFLYQSWSFLIPASPRFISPLSQQKNEEVTLHREDRGIEPNQRFGKLFSIKGQIVYFRLCRHMVSVATAQLHCNIKTAMDDVNKWALSVFQYIYKTMQWAESDPQAIIS